MVNVWFRAQIISAREEAARPRQAGSTDKILPGGWGNGKEQRIAIMIWGETQWTQPILGQAEAAVSPARESHSFPAEPVTEAHDLRKGLERLLAARAGVIVPTLAHSSAPTGGVA